MKYLYCPKCKDLRVKPWYSIRDRCPRCYGDVRPIKIPPSVFTYIVYATTAGAFALLFLYSRNEESMYLYTAVGLAAAMIVAQLVDLSKGEKYARAKIKVTKSDMKAMQEKRSR